VPVTGVVKTFKLINGNAEVERTIVIYVTNGVEVCICGESICLTFDAIIPPAKELTSAEATDFDECLVNIHAVVSIVVSIATKADEAAKCAKFSLGASVELDLTTGNCVPV